MSTGLSAELNVLRLVARQTTLNGTLKLSLFKRLSAYLCPPQDTNLLGVELSFFADDTLPYGGVDARVTGAVPLSCFRCSGAMVHHMAICCRIAFAVDEADIDRLSDQYEPVIIDSSGVINSVDLLEDELILKLPIAPRHDAQTNCLESRFLVSQLADEKEKAPRNRDNPFAVLKHLKKISPR